MKSFILLCAVLLSSMLAYAGGDVYFASNLKGHLRIYNKKHEEWDIQSCRYNVPNKTVYCEVNVHYTAYDCREYKCEKWAPGSGRCERYNYEHCIRSEKYPSIRSYRLRIPITSIDYISNEQCSLKYGSTFKYTYLHAKNSKNNKYQNTQTLCSCNNDITSGKLPSTLRYDTPKQRFQFITSSGCQFYAYYDKITTTEL